MYVLPAYHILAPQVHKSPCHHDIMIMSFLELLKEHEVNRGYNGNKKKSLIKIFGRLLNVCTVLFKNNDVPIGN